MGIWLSGKPEWVRAAPGRYVLANAPVQAEVVQIKEGRWAAFLEKQVLSVYPSRAQAMLAVLTRLGAPQEVPDEVGAHEGPRLLG